MGIEREFVEFLAHNLYISIALASTDKQSKSYWSQLHAQRYYAAIVSPQLKLIDENQKLCSHVWLFFRGMKMHFFVCFLMKQIIWLLFVVCGNRSSCLIALVCLRIGLHEKVKTLQEIELVHYWIQLYEEFLYWSQVVICHR